MELLSMSTGEDWLMRPVLRGMIRYESLVVPGLDLCDIADLNEAIDVEDENRARVHKAMTRG